MGKEQDEKRMDFGIHSLMYVLFLASGVVMASTPQASNYGNLLIYTLVTFLVLIGVVHLFHERKVYSELFKNTSGGGGGWFYRFIELVRYLIVFLMIVLWLVYSISVYPNQQSNSVDVYACAWSNTTNCISGNTTEWSTNSICGGAYNAKYPILYSVMNAITDFVYAKYTLYTITMVIGLVSMKDVKIVKSRQDTVSTRDSKNYIWIVLFWLCFVADVLINCLYNYNVTGSSFDLSTSEEYTYVGLIANAFLAFMFAHTALEHFFRVATKNEKVPIVSYLSHNAGYVIIAFLAMELYTQSLLFSDSLRVMGYFIITMFVPLSMSKITLRTPLNPTVLDLNVVLKHEPVVLDFFRIYATCNAVYYLFFTVLYSIWKGSYVSNQFLPLNTNAWAFSPSLWCGPYSWNVQEVYAWIYTLVVAAITAIGISLIMGVALAASHAHTKAEDRRMANEYKEKLEKELEKIKISAAEGVKDEKV
jgi:hypothetical protein